PERKRMTPLKPTNTWRVYPGVSQRWFRDRVIHLLALKNYKKPELLVRLQRDGIMQQDRDTLGKILHQVANLNPNDNSFSLKEHLFKDIQKDWPGYSEIDRKTMEIILSRKSAPAQNDTRMTHLESWGPSDPKASSR
ncbi:ELL2 factor, partial [Scytalopus superciliaris]|nr:ELL2 factor [Scytalopus superciliaris]